MKDRDQKHSIMLTAGIKKFNLFLEPLKRSRKTLMSQHLAWVVKI